MYSKPFGNFLSYNMLLKQPLSMVRNMIPGDNMVKEEITKFIAEVTLAYAFKYMMGKEKAFSPILLKQLISQGGVLIYKQF